MKLLFVSKDAGNVLNGAAPIMSLLSRGGHEVTCLLQRDGTAWTSYSEGSHSRVFQELQGVRVVDAASPDDLPQVEAGVLDANAVLVTLSGSGEPNVECDAVDIALTFGKPVYAIEEMFGGRHNPGFEDLTPRVKRLFTIAPMEDDRDFPVQVVGALAVWRYKDVSVSALGESGRRKLGVTSDTPLVYWSGHPNLASAHVLSRVCEAVAALKRKLPGVTLVVARHSRDRGESYSHAVHRSCLHLAHQCGIRVIENSPDHWNISPGDPEGILPYFCSPELATLQELLCSCYEHGVIVSGFGTDAAVVAPYLGIPSGLFIDRSDFLLGRVLKEEKRIERLPLAGLRQVGTVEELFDLLKMFLMDATHLEDWRGAMAKECPFPAKNPAELIADQILADAGV